jgi:hypothetical protein
MSRFKLLLAAAVLMVSAVATQPAKSTDCINQGSCMACVPSSTTPRARPCFYNPCTGVLTCGSCSDHCVPPPA